MAATVQTQAGAGVRARRVSRGVWGLLGLYVCSVLVYVALGRLREVPFLNPDEFIYGHLAQGFADGSGFDWRGEAMRLYSLLYVVLITPAWLISSAVDAFAVAKVISAVLACTVCVPVFFLARTLLGSRPALLAAGLSLAGTWMAAATMLMTENAALPLATAALCCTVMALRAPGSRWAWWAMGFAAFAACSRVQVALLFPVILLALAADVARHGPAWRARAHEHRAALVAAGAASCVLVLMVLAGSSALTGTVYEGTTDSSIGTGVAGGAARQLIVLVAMLGFVPAALLIPMGLTSRGWHDATVGPLLAVLMPATLLFAAQSAWFLNGLDYHWAIQRYVEYVVPLALVATLVVAQRWRTLPRWAWLVPLVLAPLLLLGGELVWSDALGAFATGQATHALGAGPWVAAAIALAVLGSLGLWVARREGARGGDDRAAIAVGVLLLVVLVAQSAVVWIWPVARDRSWRAGFPSDLAWLDKAAGGPASRLIVTSSHPRWPTVEFFNRDVDRVYALDSATRDRVKGKVCSWTIGPTGEAVFDPSCGPTPTRFYLDDPAAKLAFNGQRTIARTRGTGRIVEVPGAPSVPKVAALLVLPCDDRTLLDKNGRAQSYGSRVCRPLMSGYFWLDAPGTLVLGVRGGKRAHTAVSGDRSWPIAAGRVTTIRVPLPPGASRQDLRFDHFELPLGYPDVVAARLESGGRSTPLF